ncbi:MAG TPA: PAS domain S-box protein [Pyrinomonadaceae bacterium]|jgi:PAS domain S-box-containing protein
MARLERSLLTRYGIAVLAVAAALLLSLAVKPLIAHMPFAFFFAAVLLSAWYGGLRPAILSIVLSCLVSSYFFLPPAFSLKIGLVQLLQLAIFSVVSLFISFLTAAHSRSQEVLRSSEARYRTMIEQSPFSIQVFSPDGRTIQTNRAWEQLWGVTLDQIAGYNILEDPQLIAKGVMPYIRKAFDGQPSAIPPILYDPEETIPDLTVNEDPRRWVRAFIYPLKDDEGNIRQVILMHEDITEQKRAEEAIQFQAHLLDTVEQAVIATDLDGNVSSWNHFAEKLYGWTREEALGHSILDLTPAVGSEEYAAEIMSSLQRGESWSGEIIVRARDGKTFPAMVTDTPVYDEHGTLIGIVGVSADITERKRAEKEKELLAAQVEQERQRLGNIVASVPGVVWEAWGQPDEATQSINFVSDYVETMLGYTVQEWLANPNFWLTIVHPEDQERAGREATAIFVECRSGMSEFRWLTKDGRVIWVEAQSVTICDEEGRPVGMRGVTMDITERKQIEEERARLLAREQEARLKAEENNRAKDEFLAMLSHELRTPLTAMLGWTRMLRTHRLDEKTAAHALEIIERNATAQAQLVEDLLDVSRIITGKIRLETEPVDLVPVIGAAIDAVRPAAEAKGLELEVLLDPHIGPVSGDASRLQQVVWNLLINAVKFTPQGGRIIVQLDQTPSQIEIKVSDTGQGIGQDFLPFVFDRFRQADSSTTRAHGGLGVGLALVRHLVEIHGGEVEAESEGEGRGSTFTVRLPRLQLQAEASGATEVEAYQGGASSSASTMLSGLKLLIVDDEEDMRDLLRTLLEEHGGQVTAAANAEEAVHAIEEVKPHLLISDIGMPGEDGYALMRRVRALANGEGGLIPAVALTAYAGEEAHRQALAAGFQVHLAKPVDPTGLLKAILNLVQDEKR